MKLLIIGAGGVGTSAAKIIQLAGAEGDWAEKVVVADFNEERAKVVANEICGGGNCPYSYRAFRQPHPRHRCFRPSRSSDRQKGCGARDAAC